MATSQRQETQDGMLREWARTLQAQGYSLIAAILPEFTARPQAVPGGSVPDLSGLDARNSWVVGAVKTCDDLETDRTRREMSDYYRAGSKVLFLVPKTCEANARKLIQEWGFENRVEVWTHAGL